MTEPMPNLPTAGASAHDPEVLEPTDEPTERLFDLARQGDTIRLAALIDRSAAAGPQQPATACGAGPPVSRTSLRAVPAVTRGVSRSLPAESRYSLGQAPPAGFGEGAVEAKAGDATVREDVDADVRG